MKMEGERCVLFERVRSVSLGLLTVLAVLMTAVAPTVAQTPSAGFDEVAASAAAARTHNDVPGAITAYAEAVQLKPDWAEGWWYLGMLQYNTGGYAASRDAFTQFLKLTPDSGPAFAVRGLCEFQTAEFPQSAQDIEQGLALGAGNQPYYENILRLHQLLLLTVNGDFETALREYAGFAKVGTSSSAILVGIGLAGLRMPMRPQDVDPSLQDLVLGTGTAAFTFMAGDDQKAQQQFHNLFQRFPHAANAHYLYGYLQFANDPDEAVEEFRQELKIAPTSAVTHVMLAWYFLLRDDPSDALPYAQKAATEASSSPTAQLVLGRSLVETGMLNEGMDHLNTALKLDPENLEVHLALAKGYSELGRKKDAAAERSRCAEMAKGQVPAVAQP
jgi:tetratricopeptide (TPR) repeat protein